MRDAGLLVLRLTAGGLLAGHGAQKLFGAIEGPGPQGTAGMMESLGLRPGNYWGRAAALTEFGGGVLTALGLFDPLGPLGIMSAMSMATAKVHWGKPIWVTAGGAELPLTNLAAALAVAMSGPGRYSLDHLFGLRVPRPLVALAGFATGAALVYGITQSAAGAPSDESAPDQGATGTTGAAVQDRDASEAEDEEVQPGYGGQTFHSNPDEPPGKSTEPVASQEHADVRG